VRGRVYLHFASEEDAREALLADGFESIEIARASDLAGSTRGAGSRIAHIIEASTS
jgi:hypothetical protein